MQQYKALKVEEIIDIVTTSFRAGVQLVETDGQSADLSATISSVLNTLVEGRNHNILSSFIAEIKNEFKDQNWDYLDFIAERVLKQQPEKGELSELSLSDLSDEFLISLYNNYALFNEEESWHTLLGGEKAGKVLHEIQKRINKINFNNLTHEYL